MADKEEKGKKKEKEPDYWKSIFKSFGNIITETGKILPRTEQESPSPETKTPKGGHGGASNDTPDILAPKTPDKKNKEDCNLRLC